MKLAHATWKEVEAFSREAVVLIPTGSLEQHGAHLPLITDTLIATSVAEAVEARLRDHVVLSPTLWLGASGHHLAFPGSLSATMAGYGESLKAVCQSLIPHGFTKFFVINGHGGNTEPNGIALRELKASHPALTFGHSGYFSLIADEIKPLMEGPAKEMRHACEAETSLVMHLRPELVRTELRRNDGLVPDPPLVGMVHHFDEMTEEGSFGYATFATAAKGKAIFEAAVEAMTRQIEVLANGYVLTGNTRGEDS
ncbi:MAG TPA: creatininase family protein [Fimbriimonadaceae bacterium]|nr:creatininase family protein [Fimbriimonadaceae bacterium]